MAISAFDLDVLAIVALEFGVAVEASAFGGGDPRGYFQLTVFILQLQQFGLQLAVFPLEVADQIVGGAQLPRQFVDRIFETCQSGHHIVGGVSRRFAFLEERDGVVIFGQEGAGLLLGRFVASDLLQLFLRVEHNQQVMYSLTANTNPYQNPRHSARSPNYLLALPRAGLPRNTEFFQLSHPDFPTARFLFGFWKFQRAERDINSGFTLSLQRFLQKQFPHEFGGSDMHVWASSRKQIFICLYKILS